METSDLLKHLLTREPGPLSITLLEGIDRAELDFEARVDYAKAWELQRRWAESCAQKARAQVARARP